MGHFKNSFATEAVRRYLLQIILHSGGEPKRLPTDRELTETLGLSRVTVRRAVSDLESGRYILRIPGKQGIYTNPAMAQMTLHSIGLLCSSNYIGKLSMLILGAMAEELTRRDCNYSLNLFMLHDAPDELLENELRHGGFDCILDFEPSALTKHLRRKGLPILAVEHFGYPDPDGSEHFGIDHRAVGRALAVELGKRRWRRVVYCGEIPEEFAAFEEAFGASTDGRVVIGSNLLDRRLPELLRDGRCDCLVAMTREVGFRKIIDVLEELQLAEPPEIFPYPGSEAKLLQSQYPQYRIRLFDVDYFHAQLRLLGRALADGVMRILSGRSVEIAKVQILKTANNSSKEKL